MAKPRVILYDIETSHNEVAAFRLRDDIGIPHDNILKERRIFCVSWKVLGSSQMHSNMCASGDDAGLCGELWDVLDSADVVVAHYGDKFDYRYVKGRMLFHGLTPFTPPATVDTYKIAKKHFDLNSYRLDYIGKFLGVGGKTHTSSGLWLRALAGDKKALREMVSYNQDDVELLERVYLKLQPYVMLKNAPSARKVLNG